RPATPAPANQPLRPSRSSSSHAGGRAAVGVSRPLRSMSPLALFGAAMSLYIIPAIERDIAASGPNHVCHPRAWNAGATSGAAGLGPGPGAIGGRRPHHRQLRERGQAADQRRGHRAGDRRGRACATDIAEPRDLLHNDKNATMSAGQDQTRGQALGANGKRRLHPGAGRRQAVPHPKGRQLDPAALREVQALLGDRPRRHDLLIEHLHLIQDKHGCLSAAHLAALASEMKLALTEVYEVATFYAHFDVVLEDDAPPPALTIRVCDSLTCELLGG